MKIIFLSLFDYVDFCKIVVDMGIRRVNSVFIINKWMVSKLVVIIESEIILV